MAVDTAVCRLEYTPWFVDWHTQLCGVLHVVYAVSCAVVVVVSIPALLSVADSRDWCLSRYAVPPMSRCLSHIDVCRDEAVCMHACIIAGAAR